MIILTGILLLVTIGFAILYYRLKQELDKLVTEQMETTLVMSHHDLRFRYLLDSLPDYVLRFDSKLRLVFRNKASEDLVSQAELQLLDETPHGVTLSRNLTRVWFNELLQVIQDRQERTFDFETKLNGKMRYFEVRAVPDAENPNQNTFVICMIRDITVRKWAEKQRLQLAQEAQRIEIMNKFSEDITHDIRNPLSSIGASTYVLRKTEDTERKREQLDNIDNNIRQIAKMLDNMLLMTHLDANIQLEEKPIDLAPFLKQVVQVFEGVAARKSQTLTANIHALQVIQGDSTNLKIAIDNLLFNAIRYTPVGGSIDVTAYQNNQTIVIEIEDSGQGMTSDQLDRIFERFYRADPSRIRDTISGGSGLGLPIAKAIIERHGGQIQVESTPMVGSRFTIFLPVNVRNLNNRFGDIEDNIAFQNPAKRTQYAFS